MWKSRNGHFRTRPSPGANDQDEEEGLSALNAAMRKAVSRGFGAFVLRLVLSPLDTSHFAIPVKSRAKLPTVGREYASGVPAAGAARDKRTCEAASDAVHGARAVL